MATHQDLLRPFLLACNHGDASPHLMAMAMGSIQYLINGDAILPSDAPNILRSDLTGRINSGHDEGVVPL